MFKKLFLVILTVLYACSPESETEDTVVNEVIEKLKNNNFQIPIANVSDSTLRKVFAYQMAFKKQGIINDSLLLTIDLHQLKGTTKIIANYTYGDYVSHRDEDNDSVPFYYYTKALSLAQKRRDTLLINECLYRICDRIFNNEKSTTLFKQYIGEYTLSAKDTVDRFWVRYFSIGHDLQIHFVVKTPKNNIKEELFKFDKGFALAQKSAFFTGKLHQLRGIYYNLFTDRHQDAKNEFNNANINYEKIPYYFSQKKKIWQYYKRRNCSLQGRETS